MQFSTFGQQWPKVCWKAVLNPRGFRQGASETNQSASGGTTAERRDHRRTGQCLKQLSTLQGLSISGLLHIAAYVYVHMYIYNMYVSIYIYIYIYICMYVYIYIYIYMYVYIYICIYGCVCVCMCLLMIQFMSPLCLDDSPVWGFSVWKPLFGNQNLRSHRDASENRTMDYDHFSRWNFYSGTLL